MRLWKGPIDMERANYCFVCGKDNPKSLHLEFKNTAQHTVTAFFKLEHEYEGYPNIIHGGILAAILDDAMANTVIIDNIPIYTVELNVKYIKRCLVLEDLQVKGWVKSMQHRIIETEGEIRNLEGDLKTIATGKYFIKSIS